MLVRMIPAVTVVLALVASQAATAASEERAVSQSFHAVPLREALNQLYAGTGTTVEVPPAVPDAPVTAELRGIPRHAALRFLLKVSGIGGLAAHEARDRLVVTQTVVPSAGGSTATVPVDFSSSSVTGATTGPGGTAVPVISGTRLQTLRRVPPGTPVYLGGVNQSQSSGSRNGAPYLPFGSRLNPRSSTTGGTFVTITILPDPVPERVRRR